MQLKTRKTNIPIKKWVDHSIDISLISSFKEHIQMANKHVERCSASHIISVQLLSSICLFVIPWTAGYQTSLSITNSRCLLKLTSIESVMPSSHLILCHPLLLLPSIFPSLRGFSKESRLRIKWPKYCSSSFSIGPANEHSGLISFRTDWFDLLAVQGTLKSLLQHLSSKASILWCSAVFFSLLEKCKSKLQ